MPNESDRLQTTVSDEDIELLEQVVQQYAEGKITKNEAIGNLSVSVATICTERDITPDASIIQPYVEQLDAHDRENAAAGARSNTVDVGDGEQEGTGQTGSSGTAGLRRRHGPDESSDRQEDEPLTKKRHVDPSKFNWNDETKVFFDSFTVTPAHESVRKQIEVYSADIKVSLRDLNTSYGKPSLPRSQWKNILLDNFVEFNEIFSNSFAIEPDESDLLVIGDTHLEFQKPKVVSKIKKATQWNSAWRVFQQAVKFAFSGRELELERYWKHINDLFEARHESTHEFIINYDRAVRIYVGGRRDILLHEFEKFSHIKEAHLSPSGIYVLSHPAGSSGNPAGKGKKRRTDICKNYNFRQCSRIDCSYRHICIYCQSSDHLGPKCPKRSSNSA
jgi:hypothetical protein